MAYTQTGAQNRTSPRQLLAIASKSAMASAVAWRRTIAVRRAIANLTDDELRDVGYCGAARPTLEVKAGLITNLMSMR